MKPQNKRYDIIAVRDTTIQCPRGEDWQEKVQITKDSLGMVIDNAISTAIGLQENYSRKQRKNALHTIQLKVVIREWN